jgi:hypothetical protein
VVERTCGETPGRDGQDPSPLAGDQTPAHAPSHVGGRAFAPYLDDLLADAEQSVRALAGLDVARVAHRSPEQDAALRSLWDDFSRLTATGSASCVGITKAVMLATDGGFGPALDSQVRGRLSLGKPLSSTEWIRALEGAADDIAAWHSRVDRARWHRPSASASDTCGSAVCTTWRSVHDESLSAGDRAG